MFTDDELAVLDAIHANPRYDGPRLAYADWLEIHGQAEYAEFIRLDLRVVNEVLNDDLVEEDRYRNWRIPEDADRYKHLESICGPWAEPLPAFAQEATFNRGMFLVPILAGLEPAEFVTAMNKASPRLRYTLVLRETHPAALLEMIGTGRIATVTLYPVLAGREGSNREKHSASVIEAMRMLFGSPYAHLLESVHVPMARILTDEAKTAWRQLAPPFLKAPWLTDGIG